MHSCTAHSAVTSIQISNVPKDRLSHLTSQQGTRLLLPLTPELENGSRERTPSNNINNMIRESMTKAHS